MAFLSLELMQEKSKEASPNYFGSLEKNLIQDCQIVVE